MKKSEEEVAQKHNIKTSSKGGLAVESTRYQSNGGLGMQANPFKSYSSRNSGTVAIELEQESIPTELQVRPSINKAARQPNHYPKPRTYEMFNQTQWNRSGVRCQHKPGHREVSTRTHPQELQ